jgi:hypothetical protein
MTTINAIDNPDLINQAIKELNKEEVKPVVATSLPDTYVTLPGGYITQRGEVVTKAEVRELNGIDEEIIAKSSGVGQLLSAVLRRGTVSIGDVPVTPEMLDNLLSGDRDMLLLAIRAATFGKEVGLVVTCQSCRDQHDVSVDLFEDVFISTLENPLDRSFEVTCRAGLVNVSLPTGVTQRKVLDALDKSGAEINTMLLFGCVSLINDEPVLSAEDVRKLSIRDREKITEEISKRIPGPKLNDVSMKCPSCEEEMAMPLSMMSLFRF